MLQTDTDWCMDVGNAEVVAAGCILLATACYASMTQVG